MKFLLPLPVIVLLAACGMKGDLYEAPAPSGAPATTADEADKGERKAIPSTPDPARSE